MKMEEGIESLYQSPGCHPFVKWAGGKGQLLPQIVPLIPTKFARYFEPFLGGGAVFFQIATSDTTSDKTAFLSDINAELIDAYKVIKDNVEELISALVYHQFEYDKSPKKYYYDLRDSIKILNKIDKAARFITLNKTCYNGLYRVNRNGLFNVPIGRYKNPMICDADNLRKISIVLKRSGSYLRVSDYKKILVEKAEKDDFVYLDPPFHPISNTANFTSYTNNGFSLEDQKDLAAIFNELTGKGCKVLLSNSNTEEIRKLYSNYSHLTQVNNVNRSINAVASKRVGHTELLIRNYV
jgi:DNA adenine methylase